MEAHYLSTGANYSEAMCDLSERFAVMTRQESTDYLCNDYLASPPLRSINAECTSSSMTPPQQTSSSQASVNEMWREKICEWSYQVVDHFDFNREIVSISLSYLDRFLCSRPVNKKIFQLAAMTTLYLAIKLYEPGKLRMSSLIELSRGYFTMEHIVAMEEEILSGLSWNMHPPTALTQVQHFLQLLPMPCNTLPIKHDITELSRFLTELSVCDYYFVTRRPSSVALASIFNAMEVVEQSRFLLQHKSVFMDNVRNVTNIDPIGDEVEACRLRLRDMYHQGGYYQHNEDDTIYKDDEPRCDTISPVSVAGGTNVSIANGAIDHHQQAAYYNPYEEGVPTSLNYDQSMNNATSRNDFGVASGAPFGSNTTGFKKARQM